MPNPGLGGTALRQDSRSVSGHGFSRAVQPETRPALAAEEGVTQDLCISLLPCPHVREGHTLATNALNVAEVYAGMRPEEEHQTETFLGALDCYELTANAGRLAGSLKNKRARKGRTISIADAIVAAVALERQCTLITDNRKNFPMQELDLYPL